MACEAQAPKALFSGLAASNAKSRDEETVAAGNKKIVHFLRSLYDELIIYR